MNKVNIHRFAQALALALTVQYSKDIPGLKVTVGNIREKKKGGGKNG